jgi:hypothetical protein
MGDNAAGAPKENRMPKIRVPRFTFTKLGIIAVGCAFVAAAWRNMPPLPGASGKAAAAGIGLVVVGAYLLGRRSVKAEAVATAVASAEARALAAAKAHAEARSVAAVQVNVGEGARAVASRQVGAVPWLVEDQADRARMEQLEGSDAVEGAIEDAGGAEGLLEAAAEPTALPAA